jgi:hypothetical protein
MDVCYECFVFSGRGLCDGLITRPKESYRLWCVVVCDLGTSWMRRPWPTVSRRAKIIYIYIFFVCRSQWPRGLRRRFSAAHVLGLWVWIPLGSWTSVSCECCLFSGRGVCVVPITCPVESYRLWCVWVLSWILDNEETLAHWGLLRHGKKNNICVKVNITNLLTVLLSPLPFPLYFLSLGSNIRLDTLVPILLVPFYYRQNFASLKTII